MGHVGVEKYTFFASFNTVQGIVDNDGKPIFEQFPVQNWLLYS